MSAPSAMSSSTSSSSGGPPLAPVFVFPAQIDFYHDDVTTHKRVITIYNPYDFDVVFKVLCNNPKKYAVVEPEGKISAQKCADTVIRHVAISPQALQQTDKFRIHICDQGSNEILGKRDILATLHQGVPDPEDEKSHSMPQRHRSLGAQGMGYNQQQDLLSYSDTRSSVTNNPQSQQPNLIACLAGIICIIALFLPTEGEVSNSTSSTLLKDYPWLHLSSNQKLVFAYVLGLVTMAILRTN